MARCLVLAVDGALPRVVERYAAAGDMPTVARLIALAPAMSEGDLP